jgi:DNA-binding GntR family transcriptional regulator
MEFLTVSSVTALEDGSGNPGEALYLRFERILRRSIERGRIEAGTVLLEGHLADILGSSRAPVRQALMQLQQAGLVERFEGRGFRVGDDSVPVRRIKLSADMLDIEEPLEALRRSFAWEGIYEEVERTIIHRSAFGRCRVNELELARHYNVGRTVAHDVLTRLQSLGIVDKDERQRWTTVSLDPTRLAHLYELRELMEPAALIQAMPTIDKQMVATMRARLLDRLKAYPKVTAAEMNDLEYDLHVRCLEGCPNNEMLVALRRTRCTLTLSKHVLGVEMELPEHDPFMDEHLRIFDAIIAAKPKIAAATLQDHLLSSYPKVLARLQEFRGIFKPPHVPYIT